MRLPFRWQLYEWSLLPWCFVRELNTSNHFGVEFPPSNWSYARPRLYRWSNVAVDALEVPLWWLTRVIDRIV